MTGEIPEQTASSDAAEEDGMEGLARPGRVDGRAIFIGWEKLRIPYNIALVLPVLAGVFVAYGPGMEIFRPVTVDKGLVFSVVLYAIAANVFYFAGPVVETYVARLARKTYMLELRLCLFVAGTIASMSLEMLCALRYSKFLFPDSID